MTILVVSLLLLSMVSILGAQYPSKYVNIEDLTPIVLGHRQDYYEPNLRSYHIRSQGNHREHRKQVPTNYEVKKGNERDREFTVGAHLQVDTQYPTAALYENVPKEKKFKNEYFNKKTNSGKKPLFKPHIPEAESILETVLVDKVRYPITYDTIKGIDQDPREFKPNFALQDVPNLYPLQKQYQKVASKGQIQKFLEDQQKHIDETIELQLLNDPNPATKGKYQEFLKSKDDERIEMEYEENLKLSPPIIIDEIDTNPLQGQQFLNKKKFKNQHKDFSNYRTPGDMYKFTINY